MTRECRMQHHSNFLTKKIPPKTRYFQDTLNVDKTQKVLLECFDTVLTLPLELHDASASWT